MAGRLPTAITGKETANPDIDQLILSSELCVALLDKKTVIACNAVKFQFREGSEQMVDIKT